MMHVETHAMAYGATRISIRGEHGARVADFTAHDSAVTL